MKIVVLANDVLKEEWLSSTRTNISIDWIKDFKEFADHPEADAYIDFGFELNTTRVEILKGLLPKPVIVNSVINTLVEIYLPVIRVNAWPTFLQRKIIEASCNDMKNRIIAEQFFSGFQKQVEWVPDVPGFISSRIVAMIINEAYFALEDGVSTKEEINTAMKLGMNYPRGPFEWSEKIGLKNVYELLTELNKTNKRYEPAAQLKKEALK